METAWPMHPIDSRHRGSNSLGPGDLNGDGLTDYVTNYEFDQRYVIELHPPAGTDPRRPWPTVDLVAPTTEPGRGVDTENAALADLDGDGNLDVAGAQGGHPTRFWEGYEPGVRVMWGPDPARATEASAWTDGQRIPGTVEQGHYLWVKTSDVNGDGAVDLLVGGRVLFDNQRKGGVIWIEAPADRAARRDLARWTVHPIDPDQTGGHGFELADIDDDGDADLVLANADFDTPEEAEGIFWYENPGSADANRQRSPWAKHEIYRSDAFYGKPQVAVADIDGDGSKDIVTQTADHVIIFRRTGTAPVAFETLLVPKDAQTRWLSRTLKVGDLNGDGRNDMVGMATHDDGMVPSATASVFWMEYTGDRPTASNWQTHVVKWGPGRTMAVSSFGEKWDNAELTDVDGDGDLDIVANVEEWWQDPDSEILSWADPNRSSESVGVVWFENTIGADPPICRESSARCEIEAEQPSRTDDGTWVERNQVAGGNGPGAAYLQAFNGRNPKLGCPESSQTGDDCPATLDGTLGWDTTKGARYDVVLTGGEYTLWLRRYAPTRFGELGGEASDSMWVGVDGGAPVMAAEGAGVGSWSWVPVTLGSLPAGEHHVVLRARDRGAAIDRLVVTSDPAYRPPS